MLRRYYGTYSVSKSNRNKIDSGLEYVLYIQLDNSLNIAKQFVWRTKFPVRGLLKLQINKLRTRNMIRCIVLVLAIEEILLRNMINNFYMTDWYIYALVHGLCQVETE